MGNNIVPTRRVRARALETSAIAAALVLSVPGFAQCAPDPPRADVVTTCTGTDADGIGITAPGATVVVDGSATVVGLSAPAIAVNLPSDPNVFGTRTASISVAGTVNGGLQSGIDVRSGTVPSGSFDFYGTHVDIAVQSGATVAGVNGITAGSSPGNSYGVALVSLTNAGTITGTGGPALLATEPARGGFDVIVNTATGSIAGISGAVGQLANAGMIDGGVRSAIEQTTTYNSGVRAGAWTNEGTIRSASNAATLANFSQSASLTNSGTIRNDGTGAAVQGSNLKITNLVGGQIGTAGITALVAGSAIQLVNAGTITGGIVADPGQGTGFFSVVDSTVGIINGNVSLGRGNDLVYARYVGTSALVTGITGSLNGGEGTNSIVLAPTTDLTVNTAITLPGGFQRLRLDPGAEATVTLADGFVTPGTIELAGYGSIVNDATITTNGQAFVQSYYVTGGPTFTNNGSIQTSVTQGYYAVSLGNSMLTNAGTIASNGNGIALSGGTLVNTGSIVAAGTAASLFGGALENRGLIRSTAGIGVELSGNTDNMPAINSGRIEGATFGAVTGYVLTNSGTIAGLGSGTAVGLSNYGVLNNLAGGTISGGANAISGRDPYGSTSVYNGAVFNAGTIDGDVTFVSPRDTGYGSGNANRFVALTGGVLNGNLTLGKGDTLVVDLVNPGQTAFAGINGTVISNAGLLRYRVSGQQSAVIGAVGPFLTAGYELVDSATLTLTAAAAQTLPIVLAGNGTVDLAADVAVTNQSALRMASASIVPGTTTGGSDGSTEALTVVSRGTLSGTIDDYFAGALGVAVLGSNNTLQNEGTIRAAYTATNGGDAFNAAVVYTGTLINNGRIELNGSYGTYGVTDVINTGTIIQTGPRASVGIGNASTVANSGTIQTAGFAISGGYSSGSYVTNSGTIASTGGVAIGNISGGQVTNLAGGTISGVGGTAIRMDGTVENAGTIIGSVDFSSGFSSGGSTYFANGGTVAGNVSFGYGDDTFVALNDVIGVSGTVDGGNGDNVFVHARNTSGTVALGTLPAANVVNFNLEGIRALGAGTILTATASNPFQSDLYLSGDGSIVNAATIEGAVLSGYYDYMSADPAAQLVLSSFTNQGSIRDGFFGTARSFTNTGTIGSTSLAGGAVSIDSANDVSFVNSGRISGDDSYQTVHLSTYAGSIVATNTGSIEGGLTASAGNYFGYSDASLPSSAISLTNAGVISSAVQAVSLYIIDWTGLSGTVSLANSGTIEAAGPGGAGASVGVYSYSDLTGPATIGVTNSGTIRANGGGIDQVYFDTYGTAYHVTQAANALGFSASSGIASITNMAAGVIEATGDRSVGILGYGAGLDLTNAGTVRGGVGTTLASYDGLIDTIGSTYLAGAIQTVGGVDDRIVNTGTIIGSIALAGGNDSIENRGTIRGDVFLGSGDDVFLQQASATLVGTIDGGEGNDGLIVDATGGGAVNGDQFVNFERFTQTGSGNVIYSGSFRFDTIGVSGGSVTVAAGQILSSDGAVTITGGDGAETVTSNGTITGSVDLAGGNDRVVNAGAILGSVALGSGDDEYVEGLGSRVAGTVDGGAGNDLYTVMLAGNRNGIGQRTGFERLGIAGNGMLSLALDQDFTSVALAGTDLDLVLAGHRIGSLTGSDAAETVVVDGDLANVSLGGGDDQLSLGTTVAMGRYDGGTGNDLLRFATTGPVTLAGSATGFEQIALAGSALTVTGALGSTGMPLSFGNGDQQLTLASGGTLAGVIDLGAGNDAFRWMAGGILNGTVSGGAGSDTATIGLVGVPTGDHVLAAGVLTGFETLATEGNGTLSLSGTQSYDRVVANTDLVVLGGGSLTAGQVQFGGGNNRLAVLGQFAGSVDGGAGTDTIAVTGGTATAPVAFGSIANIENFGMASGYATIAGTAVLGSVDLTGGRLVGLAGSTIGATQITVRQGATFGSAGTVNGNLVVAGTLSPGASAGTMTVNGNVALQEGSVSLFELTPAVSDKLVVNGAISIASGATLQIVTSGTLRAGVSYDLVVASGGITGAYSTVLKPDSLFGFVVQRADRIQLLGQFLGDAAFSPQVARSIAYANTALAAQPATSALFAAVPALLTASGASNPTAFAQLTPEAYASATQIGVDNALTLSGAARGTAFAATGDTVHAYTFAQALGGWHRFGADGGAGTSATQSRNYGFLGGIGIGDASWSVGAFGGYLNTRQQIERLGARTRADGFVAGVHARFMADTGFGITGSVMYDGGKASTTRALPGTAAGVGRYDLHSWVGDLSIGYGIALASDWTLRPRAGITYVRTTRDATDETGGSAFALTVARDRHVAGFADAGLFLGRSEASSAPFRPFASFGGRYQVQGRRVDALAGYAGGGLGLEALGAQRSKLVGTAQAGVGYRLPSGLDLFAAAGSQTGRDDHQENITAGVRLRF
ncbi:autotransporter outer membrane beta-barrel domain-containing protein [Sphingomonas faeni]|uniref:autotransporter outer membrane beta-barrel domain-containing protein n=1 Tax=Sphingomonas faeni TaxID=185950 RepID=UPI0020C785DB|nr:autotransporter outer membrane beta-barrel domain-containing protein [Sphingomonas faeni]MCP8890978.1 autotransporter outer membrane beta-barrel domain-containing protein [Sphingomonas faeni]